MEEENTDENICNEAKEKIQSDSLVDQMEGLIDLLEGCGLEQCFLNALEPYIKVVSDHLEITPMQAVMLMPFVKHPDDKLSRNRLSTFFKCKPMRLFKVAKELDALVNRGYLYREGYRGDNYYSLSEDAKKAFCQNQSLPMISIEDIDPIQFINRLCDLFDKCLLDHYYDYDDMDNGILELVKVNPQLKLVQALNDFELSAESTLLVLYFCKRQVCQFQSCISLCQLSNVLENFYPHGCAFQRGDHILLRKGILEPNGSADGTAHKDMFRLTKEAREKLLSEYDIVVDDNDGTNSDLFSIIKASDIQEKQLFYSPENEKSVEVLADLLSSDNFNQIRSELIAKGMTPGFNCIFFGAPGTGKTETVLQLARATGRDIMKVDISMIRDMWYGNTEKNAREIFEAYADMMENCSVTPILLLNEADALFSNRSQSNGIGTTRTEGIIQNIFLECLESLDGIMIATTNLEQNMDPAFERRFLYKVQFEKPNSTAMMAIWKSLIPELNDDDAAALGMKYSFSGGEILNVAKRAFVNALLFKKTPTLENIIELCENERFHSNTQRRAIGFGAE